MKDFMEKTAVPVFLIGLLALVLGIFIMNQSPSYASKESALPATRLVPIRYLAPETNPDGTEPGICPGQEKLVSGIPTGMLSPTQDVNGNPRPGAEYIYVNTCQTTFRVLR